MVTLNVELTAEQYARYKAAYKAIYSLEEEPTDSQLIAQLKREASAITYAVEVGNGAAPGWSF